MATTVQQMTLTAEEVSVICQKEKKPRRVYATINGRIELVFGMRVNPDSITVGIWGDDVNALELHHLPLDAELTVIL